MSHRHQHQSSRTNPDYLHWANKLLVNQAKTHELSQTAAQDVFDVLQKTFERFYLSPLSPSPLSLLMPLEVLRCAEAEQRTKANPTFVKSMLSQRRESSKLPPQVCCSYVIAFRWIYAFEYSILGDFEACSPSGWTGCCTSLIKRSSVQMHLQCKCGYERTPQKTIELKVVDEEKLFSEPAQGAGFRPDRQ